MSAGSSFEPIHLNLRPHHFVETPEIREVLRGEVAPEIAAQALCSGLIENKRRPGYYSDLFGKNGEIFFQTRLLVFYRKLSRLPNEANFHIGIAPDGICNSCVVGRHCQSTNFMDIYRTIDMVESEMERLKRILSRLQRGGFTEGIDYSWRTDTHTLVDMQGQPLDSPVKGIQEERTFRGLVVKAGVLRKLKFGPNKQKRTR